MAKKTDADSFIDMFARLGRDVKLPVMDIEQLIEHHRKNLEALHKSAQAAGMGMSAVMAKQGEILQETLDEIADMAHGYRGISDPQELTAKQTEFARRSLDTALRNTGEMAELVRRSGDETLEVLRNRIREGMDEIRSSYETRK